MERSKSLRIFLPFAKTASIFFLAAIIIKVYSYSRAQDATVQSKERWENGIAKALTKRRQT